MMRVFGRVKNLFEANRVPTLRYDRNRIHRSWKYDKTDEKEVKAIKSLAEYAVGHNIPQHKIKVWTENNKIYYRIRTFMHGWTHNRYTHYMAYPDWVESKKSELKQSVTFENAVDLDPDYHFNCVFYQRSCRFCNGPNENRIG